MPVGSALPSKKLGPTLIACLCALLSACRDGSETLPHTSPPGTVDARPVWTFGKPFHERLADLRRRGPDIPESVLSIFDPARGRPVQAFADEAIGGRVAEFVAYHQVNGHWARFLFFYPAPTTGPGPGLCRSKVYSANGSSDDKGNPAGIRGSWEPDVYSVAGSVAPMRRSRPSGYEARLEAACKARRDMGYWYRAPPGKAYAAARMADSVVASARKSGALGFKLRCRSVPSEFSERPGCRRRVSEVVAAMNPRAIRSVSDCHEPPKLPCLAISLSKFPNRGSDTEGDLWTLNVHYRDSGELRIVTVDVYDILIDFE